MAIAAATATPQWHPGPYLRPLLCARAMTAATVIAMVTAVMASTAVVLGTAKMGPYNKRND